MTLRRTLSGWYINGSTPQYVVAATVKLLGELLLATIIGLGLTFVPQLQAFARALAASYGVPAAIQPLYAYTIFVYLGLTRCTWINEVNAPTES